MIKKYWFIHRDLNRLIIKNLEKNYISILEYGLTLSSSYVPWPN
jgi:hypothetical protein